MLCEKIKNAQAAGEPDTGETYYHHWLVTLEQMVARMAGPRRKLWRSISKNWSARRTGNRIEGGRLWSVRVRA